MRGTHMKYQSLYIFKYLNLSKEEWKEWMKKENDKAQKDNYGVNKMPKHVPYIKSIRCCYLSLKSLLSIALKSLAVLQEKWHEELQPMPTTVV